MGSGPVLREGCHPAAACREAGLSFCPGGRHRAACIRVQRTRRYIVVCGFWWQHDAYIVYTYACSLMPSNHSHTTLHTTPNTQTAAD